MVNSSHAARVLVVDDELLIRWALREALEARGYAVSEAADAASARRAINGARPDAIVLDYRLPDSNDLDLLSAIRRDVPAVPVIMMTAHGSPEMVAGALTLGAYRVVSKPFDLDDLARTVERALEGRVY